jgi:hypothetical protein
MVNNFRKHSLLDSIVFKLSKKRAIYDTLKFKTWLFTRMKKQISEFDPIIIGGCPRSGTTLARAMIGKHPDIASPEPEYNVLMWINQVKILKNVFDFSEKEIDDLRNKDHIVFAENLLKYYMNKESKKMVAVKHPYHILIIDELFHYFPNMKFIHVLRDGRDASCSLRTHPKRKIVNGEIIPTNTINPFNWCIRKWVVSVNKGMKWRNNENYIEIKYEDLINEPLETMKIIFDFLNLPMIPKEKLLEFYKSEKDEKHLQNIEVGQPLYNKSIDRWKKDMTPEEKELFKKMSGELLIELGYEKDNNW